MLGVGVAEAVGVAGDGLTPIGLCKPGLRPGCSPVFGLVRGTVEPLLGAALDGLPV